jgi:SAM-dependent methyltransferase
MPPSVSPLGAERRARNREHWSRVTDPQNLREGGAIADARTQLALYETADIRAAFASLGPLRGKHVLALGDGLGLGAVLLARHGARVTVADLSAPRVEAGRGLVARLGLRRRIRFVVAPAESLPFPDAHFDAAFTKSVLIHTDLTESPRELARVLRPEGRAAFIEPMRRNPFVNLYRRLAAPSEWAAITTYFGPAQWRAIRAAFPGREARMGHHFFLGFFASAFAFAVPMPRLYRLAEGVLGGVDAALFAAVPATRAHAWMGVLQVGPCRRPGRRPYPTRPPGRATGPAATG